MTPAERPEHSAILSCAMIVELATLSAKQRPFVTPLWFVTHDGAIYITTGSGSWAGRNVIGQPEVALLFRRDGEHQLSPALRVRGRAECRPGLPPWPVLWKIARKYYLTPRGLRVELSHRRLWPLRKAYYAQAKGGAGYLVVTPLSLDMTKRTRSTDSADSDVSRPSVSAEPGP